MNSLNENKQVSLVLHPKRLGYLSAAPRVSTRLDAEASGPRTHVLGVIEAFKSLGWVVHPYIVGDRLPRTITVRSEERMERSFFLRLGADIVRLILGLFHSMQAWRELNRNVDWVYERLASLQLLGWIFQRQGIPWILETSGLFFYEAKVERKSIVLSAIARMMELWAYRKCDVLVCVSNTLKEMILDNVNIPSEKILVIPNGVDTIRFDPKKYTPKRLFDGPVLGFVGALVNWHRLDVLLESLANIRREGIHLNLVVVGDGPMRATWEEQAAQFELQEYTCFTGRVSWDQIPPYIAGFDLGFMGNAKMEIGEMYHSPLKLYEYMAMGLPVIASSYEDAKKMINHGEQGYLFSPSDKDDLKQILRQAYKDQCRWKEIGMAAREKVLGEASWLIRVKKMNLDIDRVLKERDRFNC
ncbi:MAG: glycosyltransferase family 4 protein [Chloroflexota bacterium]